MVNERRFNKAMNSIDVGVVPFGAMIVWGWGVSSGRWIQNAGVIGTVRGFVIGGTMILFVGMTYAELTSAMPLVGGEHVFSYKAFGLTGSFICTWALILSYIGVVCFEAASLPTIIQYIFPPFQQVYLFSVDNSDIYLSEVLVSSLFTVMMVTINIYGIKTASNFQTILTVIIAVVGAILVVASVINGNETNLKGQIVIGEGVEFVKNIMSVALVSPFFLLGFDVILRLLKDKDSS